MSSKKYGPTLIIDLAPPPLQLFLIITIHTLALWGVLLCDFSFAPTWVTPLIYTVIGASVVFSGYHFVRSTFAMQKLIVSTDGHFLLDDGSLLPHPIQVTSVGMRGRYMMIFVFQLDGKSQAHILTPGKIGQALYRQLRVRLSIQSLQESATSPTYWQRIFQRA